MVAGSSGFLSVLVRQQPPEICQVGVKDLNLRSRMKGPIGLGIRLSAWAPVLVDAVKVRENNSPALILQSCYI